MPDYDIFLKQGLPIVTGVIGGACRHLIKDRMDSTGSRRGLSRGLKGAEAALRIRSLRSGGDFDSYRAFHQARERERNHFFLYDSLPKTLPVEKENGKPSPDEP